MSTLAHFIAMSKKRRTQDEWAQMFGISRSYFSEILSGKVQPGWNTIQKIHAATGGKVSPNDWAADQPRRKRGAA